MNDIDLTRFPQLEPIQGPPPLGRLNGFGVSVYGRREADVTTGTYVKTLCISALFIPVFCLRAYRVADAERGWYFLGREPLSGLAKAWNSLVVLVSLATMAMIGLSTYTSSPEYRARESMAEAEQQATAGHQMQAAQLWFQVADGRTSLVPEAVVRLEQVVSDTIAAENAASLASLATSVQKLQNRDARRQLSSGLFDAAITLIDSQSDSKAGDCLKLLDAVTPFAADGSEPSVSREALLEKAVMQEPNDPGPASELAVLLEARGELERCEAILAPHAQRLGQSEGARILGQLRAQAGRLEESRALLLPYTQGHLKRLAAAERAYNVASEEVWSREIEKLDSGVAPRKWYDEYDAASEADQARLVEEWVWPRMQKDSKLKKAEANVVAAAAIVPVALDLGIVMTQRAQTLAEVEARQSELEAAEEIFLGIQGFAGDSDEYRLSLGQVYYWLGRDDEGRALLDELLQEHQREPKIALAVSQALREVGVYGEARELAEEAYEGADDQQIKLAAAQQRALLHTDEVDQLLWYERADSSNAEVRASLFSARGRVAHNQGRTREAGQHFRKALEVYRVMPETSATLNNAALVHFELFSISGDRQDFHAGAVLMERSVALEPGSPILLDNAAWALTQGAVLDVIGDTIDVKALGSDVDVGLLSYLHDDHETRSQVLGRFTSHPSTQKARAFLEKVLVLSPKKPETYQRLVSLIQGTRDEATELERLLKRLEDQELDFETSQQLARSYYSGDDDDTHRTRLQSQIDRQRQSVQATRAASGVTFAVVAAGLSESLLQAKVFGLEVDADEVVALAERAYEAAPSSGTRGALEAALLFRAAEAVATHTPAWAEALEASRRALGATYAIPLALTSAPELAEPLIAHADVKRVADLVVVGSRRYPESVSPHDWALLSRIRPEAAADEVHTLRQSKTGRLKTELAWRLAPASGSVALNAYWLRLMEGRDREGSALLEAAAERGIPLPLQLVMAR